MAAASPMSTQLLPGSEIPGGLARGEPDGGGSCAVVPGLAAADPMADLLGEPGAGVAATTPSSRPVGAVAAGPDGAAVVGGADGTAVDRPGADGAAGSGAVCAPAGGVASSGSTRTQPGSMCA